MGRRLGRKDSTKEEIRKVIELWDSMSANEIAAQLGRSNAWVRRIAVLVRQAGYDLPRKAIKSGQIKEWIKEVIAEKTG